MNLSQWAIKWQIPYAALDDLRSQMGMINTDSPIVPGRSESAVQSLVRLEASRLGWRLLRNNVGAGYVSEEKDGLSSGFMRWGLANTSSKLNQQIKSADLIGIKPVLITQSHVGTVIGQFLSRETKKSGWQYSGTEREQAQLKWAELILSLHGDAAFTTGKL